MTEETMMERVMTYVDGELDPAAAAAFEREIEADAKLRAAVERERLLRARLAAAFDEALDEPVPERLRALLTPAAEPAMPAAAPVAAPVADLAAARAAKRERAGWGWAQWGGMAASLALGLVIGPRLIGDAPELERMADGGLRAGGALAAALDRQPSGERGAAAQVALSFVEQGGAYCRAFTLSGGGAAGVACRADGAWRVQQLELGGAAPSGEYRMAATALPPALLQAIDAMRAGDALDAGAERAARERGWRR